MQEQLTANEKKIWFLIMGGLNTLLGFSLFPLVYWLLQNYRSHYVWMMVACHISTVGFAYFTNKIWVFRSQERSITEFMKFTSFHLLYFLIMIFLVPFFVEHTHCNPVIVQFSISVLVVISSFFWYDRIVFLIPKR